MSGFSVTVDDSRVMAALHTLQGNLADLSPAMAGIGQVLVTETDLAFRSQKDPWGNAWAKLSAVTLARRRKGKGKGSNKILRDTGRLANSINYRADKASVSVGTNIVYAATHQFGAKMGEFGRYSQLSRRSKYDPGDFRYHAGSKKGFPIPWGDIPARPFLPIRGGRVDLSADAMDDILDVLRVHLRGGQ